MLRIGMFDRLSVPTKVTSSPVGYSKYQSLSSFKLVQAQTPTGLTGGENLRSQIKAQGKWKRESILRTISSKLMANEKMIQLASQYCVRSAWRHSVAVAQSHNAIYFYADYYSVMDAAQLQILWNRSNIIQYQLRVSKYKHRYE